MEYWILSFLLPAVLLILTRKFAPYKIVYTHLLLLVSITCSLLFGATMTISWNLFFIPAFLIVWIVYDARYIPSVFIQQFTLLLASSLTSHVWLLAFFFSITHNSKRMMASSFLLGIFTLLLYQYIGDASWSILIHLLFGSLRGVLFHALVRRK